MTHDPEYIQEFVVECREGLDRIDTVLVALEKNPGQIKGLDVVFRALHTIKGNAGFLDFAKLGAVAHAGEALLTQLVGGKVPFDARTADLLLRTLDAIRDMVATIEATQAEGADDFVAIKQELIARTRGAGSTPSTEETSEGQAQAKAFATSDTSAAPHGVSPPAVASPRAAEQPVAGDSLVVPEEFFVSDGITQPPGAKAPQTQTAVAAVPKTAPQAGPENADGQTSESQIAASVSGSKPGDSSSVSSIASRAAEPENSSFIRVQIEQLDSLMNLVGELVLARNRIVQVAANRGDDELTEPIQRLNRLTAALQDGVMRTRMQPVRNAWRKYPRIVRDVAKNCGKQCEVELHGGDTELDKSMLEAIADPLVHLVRNAIDHGIEKPYLRKIKGKPEAGRLLVRAFQESGQVHIEVSDDGAGLDLERIRKKAIEVGMLSPEQAREVSEVELRNSVFLPGFSTASKVTSMSGRGVGLDVVKTSVEQIGGTIELQTQKDVGTTIRLTVPLTLAIIPAIMVLCRDTRFAIPQINVVEMLRLRGDEKRNAINHFHETAVLRLRGELLPMADLNVKLGIPSRCDIAMREALDIVVVKTGTRRFALLVDEIGDPQEIVVKPLGELLASQSEYSGAALMGDGTISLILDVLGIARGSGLLTEEQSMLAGPVTIRETAPPLDEQVLVCHVDGDRQIALPLAEVVCLEQFPASRIEQSATGDVLQYRGEVLPLHSLTNEFHQPENPDSNLLSIVIYRAGESRLGLVVDHIVDVAPRPRDLNPVEFMPVPGRRDRVTATAVVLGRVTDFLQVS